MGRSWLFENRQTTIGENPLVVCLYQQALWVLTFLCCYGGCALLFRVAVVLGCSLIDVVMLDAQFDVCVIIVDVLITVLPEWMFSLLCVAMVDAVFSLCCHDGCAHRFVLPGWMCSLVCLAMLDVHIILLYYFVLSCQGGCAHQFVLPGWMCALASVARVDVLI